MFSSRHPHIFDPLPPPHLWNNLSVTHMNVLDIEQKLTDFKKKRSANDYGSISSKYANASQQVSDNPSFTPHIFYLLIKPNQDYKMLPEFFSFRYYQTIPDGVNFRDPRGNVTYIKVTKWQQEICLSEGWNKLVPLYSLFSGGYLRLEYIGSGDFDIQVFNQFDKEVSYPKQQLKQHFDKYPILKHGLNGTPLPSALNPAKFLISVSHSIDFEEALGVKLKLRKEFFSIALIKKDGEITIVDEYLKPWPCRLVHDVANPSVACVTTGWGAFATEKMLCVGRKIVLGVRSHNSTVLYYFPVGR